MQKPVKNLARRILVVDDDEALCPLLSQYLTQQGFGVETVHLGLVGLERGLSGEHSIIILDVMLPDIKGFEVLRRLRAQSRIPVLMLTARGDDQDRILGLEMGADDYLPKPFKARELCARIEAILRRSYPDPTEVKARADRCVVDQDLQLFEGSRVVLRGKEEVNLTTVEFDLLELFLKSPGRVLSREQMVRTVLGREYLPFDRSMDTHVSNLRKKLGPAADGSERIKGVRGIGYIYAISHQPRRTKNADA
jgi:two-component system response regulator CpxR